MTWWWNYQKKSGISSKCEIEQLLCKSGVEPPQIKNTGTVCSLNSTSEYSSKRSETMKSWSNWAPIFTAELFSANKRSGRNHRSRGRWVEIWDMIYKQNEILFSPKKWKEKLWHVLWYGWTKRTLCWETINQSTDKWFTSMRYVSQFKRIGRESRRVAVQVWEKRSERGIIV